MIEGRCAACKYLRRKCVKDCIFSPYFPSQEPDRFKCVHKLFGASNVAKVLQELPEYVRAAAADCMHIEAKRRVEDPVYGCAGQVSILLDKIYAAQNELAIIRAQLAVLKSTGFQPQFIFI